MAKTKAKTKAKVVAYGLTLALLPWLTHAYSECDIHRCRGSGQVLRSAFLPADSLAALSGGKPLPLINLGA